MDLHLDAPLVSVVMPVYNGGKYLGAAITSILNQTFRNFEFIIINDGSTDNTHAIISSFDDKRIKYISNKENLLLVKSLNIGIQQAKGKYIARMDADDISFPKRFEKQVRYLESHVKCGVLGTKIRVISDSGVKGGYVIPKPGNEVIKWRFLFTNQFSHSTIMLRRELLDRVGYYQPHEAEDLDLWVRLLHITDFANLTECLLYYRMHYSVRIRQSPLTIEQDAFKIFKRYQESVLKRKLSDNSFALIDSFFRIEKFNSLTDFEEAIALSTELYNSYISMVDNIRIKQDFARTMLYCAEKNKHLDLRFSAELVKRSFSLSPVLYLKFYPFIKFIKYFIK